MARLKALWATLIFLSFFHVNVLRELKQAVSAWVDLNLLLSFEPSSSTPSPSCLTLAFALRIFNPSFYFFPAMALKSWQVECHSPTLQGGKLQGFSGEAGTGPGLPLQASFHRAVGSRGSASLPGPLAEAEGRLTPGSWGLEAW